DSPQWPVSVADSRIEEPAPQCTRAAVARVAQIFRRNQHRDRSLFIALLAQHLGELPIRLRMIFRLQRKPAQTGPRVGEAVVPEAVEDQFALRWPAVRIVEEDAYRSAVQ